MCELMTIAAAVAFTAWHFAAKKSGRPNGAVFTTMGSTLSRISEYSAK